MRCFFCGGAAHPASGCQYTERVIACGPCTRTTWKWVRQHVNKKGRRPRNGQRPSVGFYEAASKWLGVDGRRVAA